MDAKRVPLPLPVRQHILSTSHLRGMEQPVRSFRSFIQTVPPNPSPDSEKPLPPTPSPLKRPMATPTSISPLPTATGSSDRTSSLTSWNAPSEWASPVPSIPSLSLRNYSPLLPDPSPSPGKPGMERDNSPWPFEPNLSQETPPMAEVMSSDRPTTPPRSPYRKTSPRVMPVSEKRQFGMPTPPPHCDSPFPSPGGIPSDYLYANSSGASLSVEEEILARRHHAEQSLEQALREGPKHLEVPQQRRPPRSHHQNHADLGPQPLRWRKKSSGSGKSIPRPEKLHKRMPSWITLGHFQGARKRHNHSRNRSSVSEPITPIEGEIPDSELEHQPTRYVRLRRMLSRKKMGRSSKTPNTSAPEGQIRGISPPELTAPQPQKQSPLLKLPGGFALIRQPPSEAAQSQTASTHEASIFTDTPRQGSFVESSVSGSNTSQRRRSFIGQYPTGHVTPTVAVNMKEQRSSVSSHSSLTSRSHTSLPPTSPLAQEIATLRTPPLPPMQASPPTEEDVDMQSPDKENGGFSDALPQQQRKHSILDRTLDAIDAFRDRQKEAKHEKLKQSIRVLGPTDPGVVAGYVKREGPPPGLEDMENGRLPGYMITGPV